MDTHSFSSEIFEEQSRLTAFALKHTGNFEDAQDLVQETFIKAIRHQANYQPGTNLKAWLFTILRNTFLNAHRRQMLKHAAMDVHGDLNSTHLSYSACENHVDDKFMVQDINKAMSLLPGDYSVPFLRYFEGYQYAEIAAELGLPIGTVKTRIHVARKQLKRHLKMYEDKLRR